MGRGRKVTAPTMGKGKGAKDGQRRLDDLLTPPRRSARKTSIASRSEKAEILIQKDAQLLEIDSYKEKTVTLLKPGGSKKTGRSGAPKKATDVTKNIKIGGVEQIQLLKMFDLNPTYGPCRGISRRERYLRAIKFELKPSPDPMILKVLNEHKQDFTFQVCIWDQNELLKLHL